MSTVWADERNQETEHQEGGVLFPEAVEKVTWKEGIKEGG